MWPILCVCMCVYIILIYKNYIFRTRPSMSWKDLFTVYQKKRSPLFHWVTSEREGSVLFSGVHACTCTHSPLGTVLLVLLHLVSGSSGWVAVDMKQSNLGFNPDLRTTALSICDSCVVLGWQRVVVLYKEVVNGLEIFHS